MENNYLSDDETLEGFAKSTILAHHNLHENPLFSDEGLIKIIDAYPKDQLEVFTMGYNPHSWGEWYRGRHENLNGKELMEAVKEGRVWLNLRKCNHSNPEVAKVCDELFAQVEAKTNIKTYRRDMGLLISSPQAHVFFHADMPLVMLVQIRGKKRVYLYPDKAPYIDDKSREAIAIKEHDEQLQLNPNWDEDAFVHDLVPGEFLNWRQNAPHRIVNLDSVNVSFSIEFMTKAAAWKANLLYANGCLRRYFGLNPSLEKSPKILEPLKILYARIIKAMGGYKGKQYVRPPVFGLDKTELGKINFDNDLDKPRKAA